MASRRTQSSEALKLKLVEAPQVPVVWVVICSSESIYRLSWLFNQNLSTNLNRLSAVDSHACSFCDEIYADKNSPPLFLLANKVSAGNYLFPKYKKFDYVFAFRRTSLPISVAELIAQIRKMEGVIAVAEIDAPTKIAQSLLNLF